MIRSSCSATLGRKGTVETREDHDEKGSQKTSTSDNYSHRRFYNTPDVGTGRSPGKVFARGEGSVDEVNDTEDCDYNIANKL